MPYSHSVTSRRAQDAALHQQALVHQEALRQQELRSEQRLDAVIAQYHQARAAYEKLKLECDNLRATSQRDQVSLQLKQDVIALLLPTYPHPLTFEQQCIIEAA